MKTIVFRADASAQIGTGHVMRCLTLADEFKNRGAEVAFLCRKAEGDLVELIRARKCKVEILSPGSFSKKEDAEQCLAAVKGKFHAVVVDHYGLSAEWERQMRAIGKKILAIDDLADRKHDCDFLLDPNFHPNATQRYKKLVSERCKMFLGPQFALLRPQFFEARKNLRKRSGKIRRVLVSFGGGDPSNETGKVLEALKRFENLAVDVVVGRNNPHRKKIVRLCKQTDRVSLHVNVENMAQLMAQADLAIGAGGSTTWERCLLGLPALVVLLAENQRELTEALASDEVGTVKNLGWHSEVTPNIIAEAMEKWLHSPEDMRQMSARAMKLMGENRLSELVEEILEEF